MDNDKPNVRTYETAGLHAYKVLPVARRGVRTPVGYNLRN